MGTGIKIIAFDSQIIIFGFAIYLWYRYHPFYRQLPKCYWISLPKYHFATAISDFEWSGYLTISYQLSAVADFIGWLKQIQHEGCQGEKFIGEFCYAGLGKAPSQG